MKDPVHCDHVLHPIASHSCPLALYLTACWVNTDVTLQQTPDTRWGQLIAESRLLLQVFHCSASLFKNSQVSSTCHHGEQQTHPQANYCICVCLFASWACVFVAMLIVSHYKWKYQLNVNVKYVCVSIRICEVYLHASGKVWAAVLLSSLCVSTMKTRWLHNAHA